MRKYFLVSLILSVLAFGCGSIVTPSEKNTPISAQPVSTSYFLPLITPTLATPTLQIKQTSISSKPLLVEHCLDVSSSPQWDAYLSGMLMLVSPTTLRDIYLLDMKTGRKDLFSQNQGFLADNFSVSPNGDWLAYIGSEKSIQGDSLVVQSIDRHKTYTYPVNYAEWQIIAYWLNNETLVLWNHTSPLDNILLFNPFTGEKEIKNLEYPNLISEDGGWDFSWPSTTIYDPSLKYLVYLANSNNGYQFGNQQLILWDLKNNSTITKINDFGYTLVRPIWKADGSGVVFVKSLVGYDPPEKKDEVFFLGLDGNIRQLTKLSDSYPYARIDSYGWSPNEHFLALALTIHFTGKQIGERKLLILNMSTLEISDYCLSPEQFTPFIWSPDSRYLAFTGISANKTSQTVLLDLVNPNAFVIDEKLKPAGWLRSGN